MVAHDDELATVERPCLPRSKYYDETTKMSKFTSWNKVPDETWKYCHFLRYPNHECDYNLARLKLRRYDAIQICLLLLLLFLDPR